MYRPPSLPALQALEAAARLHSFSRAARELGVTHGAISHRIREIEERLGKPMFVRRGNGMEPTPAAMGLLPAVRQSLELLGTIFPHPPKSGLKTIRIGVLPSFAAKWLVPRLDGFHTAFPWISVELDARMEISPLGPGGLDASIRWGQGGWQGLDVRRLIGETLFPACSPDYRRQWRIKEPSDFAHAKLLRNSWQPWLPWFHAAGLDMAEPIEGVVYHDAGLMLDAAVAGQGVALVRKVIAHDALACGDLVRLSPVEIPYDGAYHYVRPLAAGSAGVAVEAFGAWVMERLRQEFSDLLQD
jgi:LysR family transcriptional regulator, glycine cleavage system transcriptional activator